MYKLWYTFNDNGVVRKTVGYLYKATTTSAAQHIIDDYIDEHPLGK